MFRSWPYNHSVQKVVHIYKYTDIKLYIYSSPNEHPIKKNKWGSVLPKVPCFSTLRPPKPTYRSFVHGLLVHRDILKQNPSRSIHIKTKSNSPKKNHVLKWFPKNHRPPEKIHKTMAAKGKFTANHGNSFEPIHWIASLLSLKATFWGYVLLHGSYIDFIHGGHLQ